MEHLKWWQKAVFYQIYPRSFADGNGDGIGDFKGMIEKLDYLKDLGIDAIWLSPHYPSPQFDCGYDIADYTAVDPQYGTMEDFEQFMDGCHQRGIRLILDLVLNHTSHLHQWFKESRSSHSHPKRDWYIWKDGKNGGPPNNWYSSFGGSAWEYDTLTDQYYYHFFFKEQPDLNWRNPAVIKAMFDVARFWLKMGVDGFRLDALGTIFEHPDIPDHAVKFSQLELGRKFLQAKTEEEREELGKYWEEMFKYQFNQPGIHALFKGLRQVLDEFPDRMMVAEDDDIAYMGNGQDEMDLVVNFPLMRTDQITPAWIRQNQSKRLAGLAKVSPNAWPCNTLGNHDSPRLYSRFGDGAHDAELARLNLALMLTLKGTPFLYNGEEIGMTDLMLDNIQKFRDMAGVWEYTMLTKELDMPTEQALQTVSQRTRDKNRTPMQWRNAPNAGFSPAGIDTWLPVNPNYTQGVNVADQKKDAASLLSFYKHLLKLRKETPALIGGDFQVLAGDSQQALAFLRRSPHQTCLVVLNYSDQAFSLDASTAGNKVKTLFSSIDDNSRISLSKDVKVKPYEVFIGQLL